MLGIWLKQGEWLFPSRNIFLIILNNSNLYASFLSYNTSFLEKVRGVGEFEDEV
jgi:hypothetical protein